GSPNSASSSGTSAGSASRIAILPSAPPTGGPLPDAACMHLGESQARSAGGRRARLLALLAIRALRVDVVDRAQRHIRRSGRAFDRRAPADQAVEHGGDAA